MSKLVELTYDGGLATLTLNRPPLNQMNIEMMEAVSAGLLEVKGHREVKVLVLRGGGQVFSAGVDVADRVADRANRMLQVFHRIFESLRLLDVVSIAAVHGQATGAGFELAMGCNLLVSAQSARYRLPHIDMGIFPPLACVVLPRVSPRRKAMEWVLLGEEIPAADLERFGLVNRIIPDAQFEAGVRAVVDTLLAKSGPVLQLAKKAQFESYYTSYEEALYKAENRYLRELMTLADAQEGIAAVIENRKPKWRDA